MSHPFNPSASTGPRGNDLPAYVSNGLVGLRIREVPLVPGMAMISGIAGEHPVRRIEAAAPVPYPLSGDIVINGVSLRDQPWSVSELRQEYDFSCGELTSSFVFSVDKIQARIEVVTFASRSAPSLVLQEVAISVSDQCDLRVSAAVDTRETRGRILRRHTGTPGEEEPVCDGSLRWITEGELSHCGIALDTQLLGEDAAREVVKWDAQGPLQTSYSLRLKKPQTVRLRQIASMVPSTVHDRPDEEAVRRVVRSRKAGFEALRRANQEIWDELWHSRIVIRGASKEHQELVDAAFFYLNSSVHSASPSSTSIFGLATWHDYHYYYGHVMWDIDAFCIPPMALIQPEAVHSLLDFRSRGTPAARTNARLAGRRGLQFPWQSGPVSTQEAAPGGGDAAAYEDHASLHVARAFSLFADITGDQDFLDRDAWPVIEGVADWICGRVTRTSRGYEMLAIMGPAEVVHPPDNDAFSLMGAKDVLSRAIRVAKRLSRPVPKEWPDVHDNLYLPKRDDGAIASHDAFRITEKKGATPSPLAGLFPLEYPASSAERNATLALFLPYWKEYVGSPMLPAFYSLWAALSGDRKLSLKLFEEGYSAYDYPRFHQCLEYRTDHPDSQVNAGPFFANMGGMLMSLLFGFTGLQIDDSDPQDWACRTIVLPEGWHAIEVERLWIRGRAAKLVAKNGASRAELTFLP